MYEDQPDLARQPGGIGCGVPVNHLCPAVAGGGGMRDTIDMAREAGAIHIHERPKEFAIVGNDSIKAFEALVRADEQKKWQEQTAVEIHEAVLDEREACAKVCYELPWKDMGHIPSNLAFAAAIRARSKDEK